MTITTTATCTDDDTITVLVPSMPGDECACGDTATWTALDASGHRTLTDVCQACTADLAWLVITSIG